MVKPGLVSATLKGFSIDEVIKAALDNKLVGIEWSENHHIPLGDVLFAEKVASKTRKSGLEVAAYGSYYRLGLDMDFIPHLENAKAMGAPIIRIWAGEKASQEVSLDERERMTEESWRIARLAEEAGIKIALEWHKNTLTDENLSALELLKAVDSPSFRTLWQPTQALSFSERAEGLEMVKLYLENLHVYYWDDTGRRPLAEGCNHWEKYLSLVDDREHYALLEFVKDNTLEQLEKDSATLLSWLR